MECNYPWIFVAFIQGFTTIVAVLFLNFYINTYRRKPTSTKDTKKLENFGNGLVANGEVMCKDEKEPVANGSVSNGTVHRKQNRSKIL